MDTLTHEHFLPLPKILKMTTREISWRMNSISKRLKEDFILNAKIHGCEIKGEKSQTSPRTELTEEQQAIIDARLKKRMRNG